VVQETMLRGCVLASEAEVQASKGSHEWNQSLRRPGQRCGSESSGSRCERAASS
jgi:hypothetical protein